MALDITGTSLSAEAQATVARPCARVRFDWGNLGWSNLGAWTNESTYLRSARGESRAVNWRNSIAGIGPGVVDAAYVTLENPLCGTPYAGYRFSGSNAAGPLYAQIGEGKVRMARALVETGYYHNGTPEYLPQLGGFVVKHTENTVQDTVEFEIRDRGAAAALTRSSTAMYSSTAAGTYIGVLAALIDRDPFPSFQVDEGLVILPYAWLDEETVWEEMGLVAEAQGGRVWVGKDGKLHFQDMSHLVRPRANAWENPLVSQFTFHTHDFQSCDPQYNPEDVQNHVVVRYSPRYPSVLQEVYSASEVYLVKPNGGTLDVKAKHRYPVQSFAAITSKTDYIATSAGGTDLTDAVTVTAIEQHAMCTTLRLTNNSTAHAAFFYKLKLRGVPIMTDEAVEYECEDAASIAQYGRKTTTIENPYVVSRRQAEALAEFMLARFKDPPLTITLRGLPALPWLEVGDRVTVVENNTGINTDFFIGVITWSYDGSYTQTFELVRAEDLFPYSDYFILGTSLWGPAGTGKRLFW